MELNRTRNGSMPSQLPHIQNLTSQSVSWTTGKGKNLTHQVDIYGMIREQTKIRRNQRNKLESIFRSNNSSRVTLHERYNSQLAGGTSSFYGPAPVDHNTTPNMIESDDFFMTQANAYEMQ